MLTFLARTRFVGSAVAIAAVVTAALPYPSHAEGSTETGDERQRAALMAEGHGGSESHDHEASSGDTHGESAHGGDHEHSEMEGHDSATAEEHSHGTLAVLEGQPTPEVTLTVHDDALRGWNLEVELENFTLAPDEVNEASNTIEGHAHLYVNGVKITRLYGPWYYLESLPSGEQELRVELNANGHEVLTYDGEAIADTVIITVP